ncbi:MAG: YafY family protein [Pseudomonadota bacterium]
MRRADRLFQIIQMLRGGRLSTAAKIAEALEVSERTVYRDIRDLQSTGVPIDGEAGVGYVLRGGYDLPPLMFTKSELTALIAGARMVKAWAGNELARSADDAILKIEAVLPRDLRGTLNNVSIFAPSVPEIVSIRAALDHINTAISNRRTLNFTYESLADETTDRSVEPLGLFFWGQVWTLVGWCRLRGAFRTFRVDRIHDLTVNRETFVPQSGRTLADFMAEMAALEHYECAAE